MSETMFLTIRAMTTREELQPYLKYKDFGVRYYANERLRELSEDIFDLEDV